MTFPTFMAEGMIMVSGEDDSDMFFEIGVVATLSSLTRFRAISLSWQLQKPAQFEEWVWHYDSGSDWFISRMLGFTVTVA